MLILKNMKIEEIFKHDPESTVEFRGVVLSGEVQRTQSGQDFMKVLIRDNTGEISCRVWDEVEKYAFLFKTGKLVKVKGKVVLFRGEVQCNIEEAEEIEGLLPEEIFPSAPEPIDFMKNELMSLAESIKNEKLKELLKSILFGDEYGERFLKHPAAKSIHHAYIGGLLHHTLTVTKILDFLSAIYPVNRDLLLAGGMLHDIGKIEEINIEDIFRYTTQGRLEGHIYLGAEILQRYALRIKAFPENLLLLLKHIILSHHGNLEWGSPVTPKILEAILIHHVEHLDSKVNHAISIIKSSKGKDSLEPNWSGYSSIMKSQIYLPSPLEEAEEKDLKREKLFNDD